MTKKYKYLLVLISIYQIFASLIGIYALVISILSNDLKTSLTNIIFLSPLFLYSFVISVALLLYINNINKVLIYTYINQGIQIIQFKFQGYGLYIVLGTYLNFGYLNNYGPEFLYDFNLFTAYAHLDLNTGIEGTMFTINIIPILLIFTLNYLNKKNKINAG